MVLTTIRSAEDGDRPVQWRMRRCKSGLILLGDIHKAQRRSIALQLLRNLPSLHFSSRKRRREGEHGEEGTFEFPTTPRPFFRSPPAAVAATREDTAKPYPDARGFLCWPEARSWLATSLFKNLAPSMSGETGRLWVKSQASCEDQEDFRTDRRHTSRLPSSLGTFRFDFGDIVREQARFNDERWMKKVRVATGRLVVPSILLGMRLISRINM